MALIVQHCQVCWVGLRPERPLSRLLPSWLPAVVTIFLRQCHHSVSPNDAMKLDNSVAAIEIVENFFGYGGQL